MKRHLTKNNENVDDPSAKISMIMVATEVHKLHLHLDLSCDLEILSRRSGGYQVRGLRFECQSGPSQLFIAPLCPPSTKWVAKFLKTRRNPDSFYFLPVLTPPAISQTLRTLRASYCVAESKLTVDIDSQPSLHLQPQDLAISGFAASPTLVRR
ncbi:hypothetical protein PoB_007017400 [Plakobranchus ocellatus]|uniref:Uncharacterized protein n=1 Tax=Plakobranchus ocellatus TaxID=259542 RepID=A0AAV4DHF1_9GAST|nr:hypothetical protein PoB_007017400 [Plakobranchus ocellatus]